MKKIVLIFIAGLIILSSCKKDKEPGNKIFPDVNRRAISCLSVDKNNILWIGTDSGLYRNSTEGYILEDVAGSLNILSLFYEGPSELLWVGTTEGLSKIIVSQSGVADVENISATKISDTKVQACYSDSAMRRWFGSSIGLSLNIDEKWKKDSFTYNKRTKKLTISDIEKLSINSISSWDGDYYFTTNGKGMYRAVGYNDSIDAFSGATPWEYKYNGLAITDTMFVVFIDSKGQQWIGGKKGIEVNKGHNVSINNTTFTYYKTELPDSIVHAIAEDRDGKIWVGTEKGLTVFDGTAWTNKSEKLTNKFVTAIVFDKSGDAWIGTKKGIICIKK
jgi:ligand-binding sensor domain-containing protein